MKDLQASSPSEGFMSAKNEFCKMALALGGELTQSSSFGKGPNGEDLTQDFAFFRTPGATRTFMHFSGVHGVEGWLGSHIQRQILQQSEWVAKAKTAGVNLIFVHAFNPYGMAWQRRVNSANVDLNRNGLDFSDPLVMTRFAVQPWQVGLWESMHTPALFWKKALSQLGKVPFGLLAQTIAGGQFHNPRGIFFGGFSTQAELQSVARQIQKVIAGKKEVVVLDVHTGLGKFGQEMFFRAALPDRNPADQNRKAELPASSQEPHYSARGELSLYFAREFPELEWSYWIQEFGTWPAPYVLYRLLKDNQHSNLGSLSTFFPKSQWWLENTTKQGLARFATVLEQMIA